VWVPTCMYHTIRAELCIYLGDSDKHELTLMPPVSIHNNSTTLSYWAILNCRLLFVRFLPRYCGNMTTIARKNFTSTTNRMMVMFFSNNELNMRGFRASLKILPKQSKIMHNSIMKFKRSRLTKSLCVNF